MTRPEEPSRQDERYEASMRDALAFVRAVATNDGEAVQIMATHVDLGKLTVPVAAVAVWALGQGADRDPRAQLDRAFAQLERTGQLW